MPVIRFVVDVKAATANIADDLEDYETNLHKLIHGVFTENNLTGAEEVAVNAHIHVSNNNENCDTCNVLRYDGIQ